MLSELEAALHRSLFDAENERDALKAEVVRLRAERDRAVETRENANAVSVRVEGENERLREALERLTDALGDVRISGMAARTYAVHEAWKSARELI